MRDVDQDDIPTGEIFVEEERRSFGLADQLEYVGLIEELLAHERTRLLDYATYPPVPDVLISTIESGIGQTIPESILSFYHRVSDGLDLTWSYDLGDDEVLGGRISLHNFARVFGSWLDELWGVFEDPAGEDFSWEIRGLEEPDSETGMRTVLHFSVETKTYSLYYHDPHGLSVPLRADYMTYMDLLRLSRGFHGWQWLLTDVDFESVPAAAAAAERFHRVMPELFPREDFSIFRRR